jgi:hypothetical protein
MEKYMSPMKNDIDAILEQHHLFHLNNFAYVIGDCLFDTIQILLHFRYKSIKLREGAIKYFKNSLRKHDTEAILSYRHELNTQSLMEMHNIDYSNVYLEKMSKSASTLIIREKRGLGGDIFCIHWLSNWLKVPIRLW